MQLSQDLGLNVINDNQRCFSIPSELGETALVVVQCLEAAVGCMRANKLRLNFDKMVVLLVSDSQSCIHP